MVEIEVIRSDSSTLALRFRGAPQHVLNAIRRAVMEEVPTMAIDTIIFVDNNSVLHDEALAHRLAMVPFTSSEAVKKYKSPEECADRLEEEGCSTRVFLDVSNDEDRELVVTSGHMRVEDPDVRPVYSNIPIVVLAKGQKVVLEGILRLGRGKEHIKWSPVSVSTLTNQPYLVYDLSRLSEGGLRECLSCIANYDPKLSEEMEGKRTGEAKLDPLKPTSLLRYCANSACGGSVSVRYSEDELVLRFESTGSLSTKEIILLAIRELERKLDELLSELAPISKTGIAGVPA